MCITIDGCMALLWLEFWMNARNLDKDDPNSQFALLPLFYVTLRHLLCVVVQLAISLEILYFGVNLFWT